MPELKYKRILLKLSGEAIGGPSGFGIDVDEAEAIANRQVGNSPTLGRMVKWR